jgi:hypothetical protein
VQIRLAAFRDGEFVGRAETTVRGRVVAGDGRAIPGAIVGIRTVEPQDGGVLELFHPSGWQTTDAEGAFRIRVARGPRYRVSLHRARGATPVMEEITLPAAAEVERDFTLR